MIPCPVYTCHLEFEDVHAKVKHLREYHGWVVGVQLTKKRFEVERSR